jgi:GDP-L-fucose synthase
MKDAAMSIEVVFTLAGERVCVTGHNGMIGSAIMRRLGLGKCEVLPDNRGDLELRDQAPTHAWILDAKPDGTPRKLLSTES